MLLGRICAFIPQFLLLVLSLDAIRKHPYKDLESAKLAHSQDLLYHASFRACSCVSSSHMFRIHYGWMLLSPKECAALVSVGDQKQLRLIINLRELVMVDIMHLKQSDLCSPFSVASCLSEYAIPMMIVFLP